MRPNAVALVDSLVASSTAMLRAVRLAHTYAQADDPVVLIGATGTGKSYLARFLHALSGRRGGLIEVSAGELDAGLGRDDLFGHARGAYTGAVGGRRGIFAEAGVGSVLLDDFHLLDPRVQTMLLRALDQALYRPLGSDRGVPVQARLLVGVGRPLDQLVAAGELLPDLRYRLGRCEIYLPRLEERREEIAPFANYFLAECAAPDQEAPPITLAPEVAPLLELAPWPGNLRDLRSTVRRAFYHARADGDALIREAHLPPNVQASLHFSPSSSHDAKRRLVGWALWRTGDHVERAAALIGAHRNPVSAIRRDLQRQAVATALHNGGPSVVQTPDTTQAAS